jgi:hypothetical protein
MIKSRRMKWARHAERIGEKSNAYRILVGEPEGEMPPRSPVRRWRIILKWILCWGGIEWIHMGQDKDHRWAVVNTVKNLRVP